MGTPKKIYVDFKLKANPETERMGVVVTVTTELSRSHSKFQAVAVDMCGRIVDYAIDQTLIRTAWLECFKAMNPDADDEAARKFVEEKLLNEARLITPHNEQLT